MIDYAPLLTQLPGPEHPIAPPRTFRLDPTGHEVGTGATVMGVINLSPESRYRESIAITPRDAIRRGRRMMLAGADIIDIGAQSTTVGAKSVGTNAQLEVLLPIVAGLVEHSVPVSVETYDPVVADRVLNEGASLINITATRESEPLYRAIAAHDGAAVICHSASGNPLDRSEVGTVGDLQSVAEGLSAQVARADACGLTKLILDPGAGFTYRDLPDGPPRVRHQMKVLLNTWRLAGLGYPICNALPHAFTIFGEELRSGEGFFAVLAAMGRTSVFRTHEVGQITAVLNCLDLLSEEPYTSQT